MNHDARRGGDERRERLVVLDCFEERGHACENARVSFFGVVKLFESFEADVLKRPDDGPTRQVGENMNRERIRR